MRDGVFGLAGLTLLSPITAVTRAGFGDNRSSISLCSAEHKVTGDRPLALMASSAAEVGEQRYGLDVPITSNRYLSSDSILEWVGIGNRFRDWILGCVGESGDDGNSRGIAAHDLDMLRRVGVSATFVMSSRS